MILLEVHNRIIEEQLTAQIETLLRKEKLVELKTTFLGKCSSKKKRNLQFDLFQISMVHSIPSHVQKMAVSLSVLN